jgi:hypothetical protein
MSAPAGLFQDIQKGSSLKKTESKTADFALQRARLEAQIKAGKKLEQVTDVSAEVKAAYKEEQALLANAK